MDAYSPNFSVSVDLDRRLLRFAASGLWGEDQIKEGSEKIGKALEPLVLARKPFSILADYSKAIVQPRSTAHSIRRSFELARKLGLERIAVVRSPPLVKMQYKRLVDLVPIEFFESDAAAIAWLRQRAAVA